MKNFQFSSFQKSFPLLSMLGALTLSAPAALAQTNANDQNYLNDLYGFLQSQDSFTYTIAAMAAREIGDEQNIWGAQTFCSALANGVSPADAFFEFTSAALNELSNPGAQVTDEIDAYMAYAVGLYGGSVMTLGAAYYCPQYQPQVQEAFRTL